MFGAIHLSRDNRWTAYKIDAVRGAHHILPILICPGLSWKPCVVTMKCRVQLDSAGQLLSAVLVFTKYLFHHLDQLQRTIVIDIIIYAVGNLFVCQNSFVPQYCQVL